MFYGFPFVHFIILLNFGLKTYLVLPYIIFILYSVVIVVLSFLVFKSTL